MSVAKPLRLRLPRGYRQITETEVRRSRFLTTLARADDEDAARAVVADARRQWPDARHHCTAFVIETPDARPVERSSDDGEPAGTAGMPMLEVLRGSGVTNAVAVVTRYFGGVLLGTGGLVRAYSDAVATALASAPRVRAVERPLLDIELRPDEAGRVQATLLDHGVRVVDAAWGQGVRLTVAVHDPGAVIAAVRELVHREVVTRAAGVLIDEEPV